TTTTRCWIPIISRLPRPRYYTTKAIRWFPRPTIRILSSMKAHRPPGSIILFPETQRSSNDKTLFFVVPVFCLVRAGADGGGPGACQGAAFYNARRICSLSRTRQQRKDPSEQAP